MRSSDALSPAARDVLEAVRNLPVNERDAVLAQLEASRQCRGHTSGPRAFFIPERQKCRWTTKTLRALIAAATTLIVAGQFLLWNFADVENLSAVSARIDATAVANDEFVAPPRSSSSPPPVPGIVPVEDRTNDWTLPEGHVRPGRGSIRATALWPKYETKLGPWEPTLHRRRSDGHPFLVAMKVDQVGWLDFAVNAAYSMRRVGIRNVTIMTADADVWRVSHELGMSAFWSGTALEQVPEFFAPLPHWTWGKGAWLRVATTLHAIRQGVGSCHIDIDTAIIDDVFFSGAAGGGIGGTGSPYDMTLQGGISDLPGGAPCKLARKSAWTITRPLYGSAVPAAAARKQFYINQGFGCYASNERTAKFFQTWKQRMFVALRLKLNGWQQQAFNNAACSGNFLVNWCSEGGQMECDVTLEEYDNVSLRSFAALSDEDDVWVKNSTGVRRAHAVHPKGCGGDAATRHACKIDVLKKHNAWYVPFELPVNATGWRNRTVLTKLRQLLDSASE